MSLNALGSPKESAWIRTTQAPLHCLFPEAPCSQHHTGDSSTHIVLTMWSLTMNIMLRIYMFKKLCFIIKQVNKLLINLLQEILQSSPSSLVLPAVDCEATRYLLSFLQESGDWKLTNLTNLDVSQLELNTTKPNLLVVQLQPLVR